MPEAGLTSRNEKKICMIIVVIFDIFCVIRVYRPVETLEGYNYMLHIQPFLQLFI